MTVVPDDLPPRRLTVLDAMILVAALAAGLTLARSFLDESSQPFMFMAPPVTWWKVYLRPNEVFGVGARFASMLMLGMLAVRLRRPRPPLRRLARQPGVVACAAAAATMATNGLEVGTWSLFRTVPLPGVWDPFGPVAVSRVGPAVIASWAVLALGGRWRAEPDAVDRAGRLLGLFYVVRAAWPWLSQYPLSWLPASWWAWLY